MERKDAGEGARATQVVEESELCPERSLRCSAVSARNAITRRPRTGRRLRIASSWRSFAGVVGSIRRIKKWS